MYEYGSEYAEDDGRYDDPEDGDGSFDDRIATTGLHGFSGRPYVPPASSADGSGPSFGDNMESHFVVPRRLRDKPYELIEVTARPERARRGRFARPPAAR